MRPALLADAASVARRLRFPDRCEIAASGRDPTHSLRVGVAAGPAFVWCVDDEPCVLFGCVEVAPDTGSVWMVGTPELERHKAVLLRQARPWVEQFNARWPLLVNTADARNDLHHRFIKWLGFTFYATRRIGGLLFLDFAKVNSQKCAFPSPSPPAPSP